MKHRILLVSHKPGARHSSTQGVDAADVAELSAHLKKVGAVRVSRFWRDRIGDGHVEGDAFPIGDLSEKDFAWLLAAPKDNPRALYYETSNGKS